MNIEYELENENVVLHDVLISIPLPYVTPPPLPYLSILTHSLLGNFVPHSSGSYPTVSAHTGEWTLNPSSHSLDWSTALITPDNPAGSLEFTVGGVDAGAFFPVKVGFVGQGSVAGVKVARVCAVDEEGEGDEVFSVDELVTTDSYIVV